ncbi:MAG TPA: pilus assembly protein TadG-related protein [Acidimicrobiales bacterium]|nr:pilus assembly protein TadG-related protein [Acidimicrobiales bacterium]
MRFGHRPRRRVLATQRSERGYVLVEFALLLVPLLLMAGLSVDVGSWYNRASNIQKAADAAALAGVVWLPNETKAAEAAIVAAERNGFENGVDNVSVSVERVGERRLRVTIADGRVESFFFQSLGGRTIALERRGTAEYILPVPLGSPENRLGNDPATGFNPRLWASISAPYTDKANGDPFATKCGVGDSGNGCSPANAEYRSSGYLYVVDVPAVSNRNLTVQIYDAGNYQRSDYPRVETADNGDVNTQFELFRPDPTPLDPYDGLTSTFSMSGSCNGGLGRWRIGNEASSGTYKNRWVTLCTINNVPEGRYLMQVKSSGITGYTDTSAQSGWNQFSIKANLSGAGVQPSLYTIGDLSLFNNLPGTSGTFSSTFFLAEIEPIHRGKTLEISLFDPGDGTDPNSGTASTYRMNVLKPGGATSSCAYQTRGAASFTNLATCSIVTRQSRSNAYNGQWLDIQLPIPDTYACTTDCWWKIRYDFQNITTGYSPNDRTVWAARIIGDPVHLVEEDL